MSEQEDYSVPVDEAVQRLEVIPDYDQGDGPEPCVHTFAQAGFTLIGAHWTVEKLRGLMERLGVQESGPEAQAMGHGLVVVRPAPYGPLFLATKAES